MATKPHATAPRYWQLPGTPLALEEIPLLMGVVNVTPDSFSDGGQFSDARHAVQYALELVEAGADILDIGGESTRPYSTPVAAQEELQRVVPVVREVCRQTDVPVSIDTSKAVVARAALDQGAQIINDVTGLEGDPEMLPLAVHSNAAVCAVHMRGSPATMQDRPVYRDVVEEVWDYLLGRRDALLHAGVELQRICLDPGIGFGKTLEHNLQLLSHCDRFGDLGCPLLVGHSRKGFIAQILGNERTDRMPASIGIALALALQRVHILRVHDVGPVRQALQLFAAAGAGGRRPPLT